MKQILLVDDEHNMLTVLSLLFRREGYGVRVACDAEGARSALLEGVADLVITDLRMDGLDGMALLERVHADYPELPVVVVTAYGTIERAVEAMKKGAVDFITKPFKNDEILHVVERVFEVDRLKRQNSLLREQAPQARLVYRSSAMAEIAEMVAKVGPVNTPVLLTGESGSGKEVIARAIHVTFSGDRVDVPFVSINCPAVPEPLLESELFGYHKGAFTGATRDFRGKVRQADHGTLFLDEIGDLPTNVQPKLLRLLETKTIEPLGSTQSLKICTRVICATNQDLRALVRAGKFREDLYYRINTITITVPPVRERREDVPDLADYFLRHYCAELGKPTCAFDPAALEAITAYDWPGNVREIKNVVERAVVLAAGNRIHPTDLPAEIRAAASPVSGAASASASAQRAGRTAGSEPPGGAKQAVPVDSLAFRLEEIERSALESALAEENGNVSAAARRLGISRNTIRYRMQKYEIEIPRVIAQR